MGTSLHGQDMSRDDLRNTISSYDGSGDIAMWFKKLKVVAKGKKVKDLTDLIPCYLDGRAFSVYDTMSESEKEDADKVEATLRAAFEIDRWTAYERLQKRRWSPGEPADCFLADIQRLARLAGVTDEEAIRGAFVVGLPEDISQQLRASTRTSTCPISTLCAQARHLLQQRMERDHEVTAMVASSDRVARRVVTPGADRRGCFVCGGNHLARTCPKRADRRPREVTCWRCGEPGHVVRDCPSKEQQGNEKREGLSVA